MFSKLAFFSFTEVPDPADHRAYNEWHQLDHRPENLALPGVLHGERWVLSPDCAGAGLQTSDELRGLHYVNMYWFADPVTESFAEWQQLAERSFQWGRRPDITLARRLMMGSFVPVQGCVADRVRVSPEALPYRPNRGVAVRVSRMSEPHTARTEAHYGWHDRVLVPHLLARPGVTGAWTFSSMSTTADAGWGATPGSTTFDPGTSESGQLRIALVYLDGDPIAYRRSLESDPLPAAPDPAVEAVLFDGVLSVIVPWQWDWFAAQS